MNLSLRGKLLATSLGVVLITVCLLGMTAFYTLKNQTLSAIDSEARNYASAYAEGIGKWMQDRRESLTAQVDVIASHPTSELVPHLLQTLRSGGFGRGGSGWGCSRSSGRCRRSFFFFATGGQNHGGRDNSQLHFHLHMDPWKEKDRQQGE